MWEVPSGSWKSHGHCLGFSCSCAVLAVLHQEFKGCELWQAFQECFALLVFHETRAAHLVLSIGKKFPLVRKRDAPVLIFRPLSMQWRSNPYIYKEAILAHTSSSEDGKATSKKNLPTAMFPDSGMLAKKTLRLVQPAGLMDLWEEKEARHPSWCKIASPLCDSADSLGKGWHT